ncbi:MAG: antibiotic biosynthesis monooxygenase [Acidimicrobiia bacterium]|nr:antibiotic biosynthesis monooxygenase [Acidimicrobiia bacterium]
MEMREGSEVVSVIRHEVREGHDADYEAWVAEVLPIAESFPGHQGVAIIRPPQGSRVYTIVLHFDTLEHLRGWLESDVRKHLLEKVEPFLTHAPGEVEIRPGLEFWLSPPGQKHARPYKQFLLILSAFYPLTLTMTWLLQPLFAAAPALGTAPVRVLMVGGSVIAIMTWVVMPRYTSAVSAWLYE